MEKDSPFALLHLKDEKPFHCETFYGERGDPALFQCDFKQMPEATLNPTKSDFFELDFKTVEGVFRVRIVPKKRSIIHPLPPPIHEKPILQMQPKEFSNHWVVVGYEGDPPYLGKEKRYMDGLSFPLDLKNYAVPTVGAVDINGEPVFMKDNRDVEKFIALKEAFEAKKFKKAYEIASEALEIYPHSIFASDFLRYKIKALVQDNMKENADEIIKFGKIFIKRYASDEYLPEVLLLLARVYSATGFVSDANYFFNRLIHEHKGSKYANLGLIYLGDQLYINGKVKDATKNYLEAYYNAKDLDVASLAAYKLAVRYLDRGKTKKAVEYLKKIWEKNREFLLRDKGDAHAIAQQLAAHQSYGMAIDINKALLEKLRKLDEMYEEILFEIGEWYDEKGETKKAVAWYEKYLDQFAYGFFSEKARKNLDELFVVSSDVNATEALERYDTLMREYRKTPIADRALAAKAKLLVAEERYDEALSLTQDIETIADPKAKEMAEKALKDAATKAFESAIEKKDCKKAITMVETYGVNVPPEHDAFLFHCYDSYARYGKALDIATKRIKSKSAEERAVWVCRAVHALVRMHDFEKAQDAVEELLSLSKAPWKSCPTLDWDEVRIYQGLGKYAKGMEKIRSMAKRYGGDMRMAEIYRMGYDMAKKAHDKLQQKWLLTRLVALQKNKKSYPYSPWAEFELIKRLKEEKAFDEAIKIAEGMKALNLKGDKGARWRYELALLYRSVGKKDVAKKSFKACAEMEKGGAWRRLCQEALSLENF
ncbi:tetratricopeptide repeat protein [Hydrogenimonas sp.]|uniref:tetratricopeptide repeat protein n=1 Tax=Hydrogenimonas sp. TaxID=2231112 RepID=UPI0026348406|nr:tetratricopeptide repeat protein [Hydrogenimonas sp.]